MSSSSSSYRTLDLTLVSAQDLKDVNLLSRLEVYAAAALSCDPRTRQRTQADRIGGRNPTWNSTLRFSVPSDASELGVNLVITLYAERALGDRLVGEVRISIKELLADAASSSSARKVSYQVRRPSGSAKGILNFSYKFGDPASYPAAATASYPPKTKLDAPADEPVMAYPVYPSYPSTGNAYPPPSASAGAASAYQAPPAGYPNTKYQQGPQAYGGYGSAYGAAPQAAGYGSYAAAPYAGYASQPVKPPKKNKFGMGLGAGLLGGALGGLLIGDAIGDAVAYDAGFDDGFDFGF